MNNARPPGVVRLIQVIPEHWRQKGQAAEAEVCAEAERKRR